MDIFKQYIFQSPRKVIAGIGYLKDIYAEVQSFGAQRVLVIADPGVWKAGLANRTVGILKEHGIEVAVIHDVPPEPEIGRVAEIFREVEEFRCQLFIGIGGGSVMDVTKLLAVMMTNGCKLESMMKPEGIKEKGLPVILAPTTAGTGSEATPNAIVTIPEQELKVGIVSSKLMPDCVLLDPEMTVGLPPHLTASTGMDAFIHALECYISKKANPLSDTFALRAMTLINRSIRIAYSNGSNLEARHDMLLGSFLGGMCIASSGTAAVHALAYPLGGKYRIPHGVSNAMLLPHVMEFNKEAAAERLKQAAIAMEIEDAGFLQAAEAAERVIESLHQLIRDLNIPESLKEFGVAEQDAGSLVDGALKVTRLLDNNPKALSREDIGSIYARLL